MTKIDPIESTLFFYTYNGKFVTNNGQYVGYSSVTPELSSSLKMTVSFDADKNFNAINGRIAIPIPEDNQSTNTSTTTNTSGTTTTTTTITNTYTYYGDPVTYSYNFVIDWGDGSPVSDPITTFNDIGSLIHEYTTAGEYQITITGLCEAIITVDDMFSDGGTTRQNFYQGLKSIDSWGDTGLKTIVFSNCIHLETLPTDGTSLFGITNFDKSFDNCIALTSIPADLFDNCPDVTGFANTFRNCIDITSAAPELWVEYPALDEFATYDCFGNCEGISNYSDIPEVWGGSVTGSVTEFTDK